MTDGQISSLSWRSTPKGLHFSAQGCCTPLQGVDAVTRIRLFCTTTNELRRYSKTK